jgi:tetratricopeptide (TPR) repeat protein
MDCGYFSGRVHSSLGSSNMTSEREPIASAPTPDEVRAAVDRLVVSETFTRSPQLGAFLRYVVEAVLRGKSDRIKAYTIGVEVLRRDTKFDPQIDPIVRVEATRLRRTIERYYTGPGANDPIVIDLPRGSYVPTFRRRHADRALPVPVSPWRTRLDRIPRWALAAVAVVLVGCVIGTWALLQGGRYAATPARGPQRTAVDGPAAGTLRPGNGMPTLAAEKITIEGTVDPRALSPVTLLDKMRDAFSRFDAINIVSDALGATPRSGTATNAVPGAQIDYRLLGSIEYLPDSTMTVRFRLVETATGNVVWSRAFERLSRARDPAAAEDSIVLELAMTLLQPFGVIRSHERIKQLATGDGDPRYRCVIDSSEALRSYDPDQHARARGCLEQLTADDPSFVTGLRYLAAIYLREFQFGLAARPGGPSPLEDALRTARRVVELQPESSRGYNTLASVLLARGDIAPALAASDRAVALNRYDMAVLGDYGGRLISAGEIERGMNMLRRAAGVAVVLPSTHHFYLFLGYYLGGDLTQARYQAGQIIGEGQPLGLLARALAAAASGETARARQAVDQLASLQVSWREDPRGQLEKFFPAPAIVDRLVRDLAAAGLAGRT